MIPQISDHERNSIAHLRLEPSVLTLENEMKMKIPLSSDEIRIAYELQKRKSRLSKICVSWTLQNNTLALIAQSVHDAEKWRWYSGIWDYLFAFMKSLNEKIS